METKLRQLASLMQSAREMGWSQSLDEEDDAVRARWIALRRATLGKQSICRGRQGPPAPLVQALGAVSEWLDAAAADGAIIGGVAASVLGRPRLTEDIFNGIVTRTRRRASPGDSVE